MATTIHDLTPKVVNRLSNETIADEIHDDSLFACSHSLNGSGKDAPRSLESKRSVVVIQTRRDEFDRQILHAHTEFGFMKVPRHLRYIPGQSFDFGMWMNCGISLAATILISNLYYCQPLLIEISRSFGVSYEGVSRIPTLMQAGYAVGIFFICPLGDLVRRRQLILLLILATTSVTVGFAVSSNLLVFEILSFILGIFNISAQILVPLAADLAPPERRAFYYSIVLIGILSGLMIARLLAGLIAQFDSWRIVYYMAIGAQCGLLVLCYFIIPDYPAKNKNMTYCGILWSMIKFSVTEPLIVQIEIMAMATSACFSAYWVTLTFLLGGPPYAYSTIIIGLFGLLGLAGMITGPLAGKFIDRAPPWHIILISTTLLLVFQALHTAAGGISIAAVIIGCIALDGLRQVQNVAMVSSIFSVDMNAISRLNSLFVLSYYVGQLMGTSVGTLVFVQYGWRAASVLQMGWYTFQIGVLLLRGPHCGRKTWLGYEYGWHFQKRDTALDDAPDNNGYTNRFQLNLRPLPIPFLPWLKERWNRKATVPSVSRGGSLV